MAVLLPGATGQRMSHKRFLLFVGGLLFFILLYTASAYSAANSVPLSNAKVMVIAKDPNQFKPTACASLTFNAMAFGSVSKSDTRNLLILGSAGSDTLTGGQGNDCIVGGAGDDNLDGGSGNNIMLGGPGNDVIDGGTGHSASTCYGGGSNPLSPPGKDQFKQCDVTYP